MSFSLRSKKSRSVGWENHFLFPLVGKKAVDQPIARWDGTNWSYGKPCPIGLLSADVSVEDPVAAVVWGPKICKIVTKSGLSLPFPREYIEIFIYMSKRYIVLSIPSVYTVFGNGKPIKVLGCFGYCEEDASVIIFNVRDLDSDIYNVQLGNSVDIFYDDKFETQAMPAYSGLSTMLTTREIEEIKGKSRKETILSPMMTTNELEQLKAASLDQQDQLVAEFKKNPPKNDEDLIKRIRVAVDSQVMLKRRIAEIVDPTFSKSVTVYDRRTQSNKRKDPLERELDRYRDVDLEVGRKYLDQIYERTKKSLGDQFPLPDRIQVTTTITRGTTLTIPGVGEEIGSKKKKKSLPLSKDETEAYKEL